MLMTSKAGEPRGGGFTLIELLVTLGIMGMLLGAAAIAVRGLRSPALASAANEVASAMKMTRQMAIASGRRNYLLFPISANTLTTNLFRTYAVFEEVPPGEQTMRPTSSGAFFVNNDDPPRSWFIPRTDWRTLPEGVVFCNLATATYNTINLDPFTGLKLGELFRPTAAPGKSGEEWKYFESFADFYIQKEDKTTNATLNATPFIAFYPNGRAYYINPGNRQGAGLRLVPGIYKNGMIALTDTNNFFTVETDPFVGRVRVRSRDSYRR